MVFDILKEILISNSQEIYKIIDSHVKMRSLAILTLRVTVLFDSLLNFLLNKWPKFELAGIEVRHYLLEDWVRHVVNFDCVGFWFNEAGLASKAAPWGVFCKHGLEFFAQLRYDYFVSIERLVIYHKSYIRKFLLIQHLMQTEGKSILGTALTFLNHVDFREIWARIGVQNIDVLEVILAITASDNI